MTGAWPGSSFSNRTSAPARPAPANGQRKPGMEPAGVRRRRVAGIGDLERDLQRRAGEPIFDREFERERIERARLRVVAQRQPGECAARRLDGEVLAGGEAVQTQRIASPADPRAVARPADHRIEDRADLAPDRRIARPQQFDVADAPGDRFGAAARDRKPRRARGERDRRFGHGASPGIAATAISESLRPGAQATIGAPRRRPSPARKSLT